MIFGIGSGKSMRLTEYEGTNGVEGSGGITIEILDADGHMEDIEIIHENDIVSLFNYWRDCKEGFRDSEYGILSNAEEERRIYC